MVKRSKNKYLIRLDDACPMMDASRWQKMENILDRWGVRPLVGLIPHNDDPETSPDPCDEKFYDKVHRWEQKGWAIALHGYNHICISEKGMDGENPMWKRSEFAGVPLEMQKEKIRNGIAILKEHDIHPRYFFAPSHTYDKNSYEALLQESDIRIICDTIATKPYKKGDFIFIPQLGGHCFEMPISGIWVFCLHPTAMRDVQFNSVDNFLAAHKSEFVSFADLDLSNLKPKNLTSRLLSLLYFTLRKLRGIK